MACFAGRGLFHSSAVPPGLSRACKLDRLTDKLVSCLKFLVPRVKVVLGCPVTLAAWPN